VLGGDVLRWLCRHVCQKQIVGPTNGGRSNCVMGREDPPKAWAKNVYLFLNIILRQKSRKEGSKKQKDILWIVRKIVQPNQTVKIWHGSNNTLALQTRSNLSIASLKLCCLAGSFEYNKPIFEDKKNLTLREADKIAHVISSWVKIFVFKFLMNGLTFVYIYKQVFQQKLSCQTHFWSFHHTLIPTI
jgi:hypothetical protein